MSEVNLGRVQGGSIFFSTASSGTSIAKSTLTPTGLIPLIGDCVVFPNGDLRIITSVSDMNVTCGSVAASIKGKNGINGRSVYFVNADIMTDTSEGQIAKANVVDFDENGYVEGSIFIGQNGYFADGGAINGDNITVTGIGKSFNGIKGLSLNINGTTKTFNGSADVALGSLYAPTTAGSSGQIPVSQGAGAPVMKTLPLQYFGRDTSSATSFTKTVTIDGFPNTYVDGMCVTIYFEHDLSSLPNANYPSIQINDLFAKTVYDKYGNHVNKNAIYQWAAGSYVTFVYSAENDCFTAIRGMTGSFVFGTTTNSGTLGSTVGDKIFTIYGEELKQRGRISVYAGGGSLPSDIAFVQGQAGYWGKQVLCATAFIPNGYSAGIYVENMQTMNYTIRYLDY